MSTASELQQARRDAAAGRLREAAATCLGILRREPDNETAILLYGDLAMDLNQNAEATVIFQKLLELTPEHPRAHERLAWILEQIGDFPAARKHARTALRLNPRSAMAHTVVAKILLSEKREEEALEAFGRARSFAPGKLGVEGAYVEALLATGQFSRACEVLKKLIPLHPDKASLVNQLVVTRKWRADEPDIALVRALCGPDGALRQEIAVNAMQSRQAYMALFKLDSDLGNLGSAFRRLSQVKELRKQESPYDAEKEQSAFANTKRVFDAAFLAEKHGLGSDSEDPIFVVGMPRSGTTLLERVLSSSPSIAAAGELNIVERIQQEVCAYFGSNQYDIDALRTIPDEVWQQMGANYVARAWKRLPDAVHFVDKMPDNYLNLGLIKLILPRARVIHISRHPVANCLSIFEQDFRGGHAYSNDLSTLGRRYLLYRDLMDHWRALFGENITELCYEELVADTPGTVARLNLDLGLDIDLELLDSSRQSGEIRTASRWQARQEIHTDSIERWRRLGPRLQPLIDALAPVLDEDDLR